MKTGKYTLKELFLNRYVQQIVIPEIQRDYVWGVEQVEGLVSSILKDFNSYRNASIPNIDTDDANLVIDFELFCKRRNCSSNIGFIYAYSDDQLPGRYFLIDGQQRLTTINLLLIAIVSMNKELMDDFTKSFMQKNKLKLNYKVRESANNFFNHFVNHELSDNNEKFQDQLWNLDEYKFDQTISSIIEVYPYIKSMLDQDFDLCELYKYITNYTEFWYFDTNISEQGEELYIYMNARGEQMQGNENIKADLLSHFNTTEEKNKKGTTWESWQDFFWENKGLKNKNADKGFNVFLSCIAGLKNYIIGEENHFYSKEDFDHLKSIRTKDILNILNFDEIQECIEALKKFISLSISFDYIYTSSSWYDKAIELFWSIINEEKSTTNWFADFNDPNRATESQKMVYIWSIIYFFKKWDGSEETDAIRFVRIIYLRYYNYIRAVGGIKKFTDSYICLGFDNFDKFFTEKNKSEEFNKIIYLNSFSEVSEKKNIEEVIWKIEDHPLNLEGKDIGGTNISHLIELDDNLREEHLITACDRFYDLFESYNKNWFDYKLVHALLHYGDYTHLESPWYYENISFNSWGRTIRDNGFKSDDKVFRTFFNDLTKSDLKTEEFIDMLVCKPISKDETSFCNRLLWYSSILGEDMWQNGHYIAVRTDWAEKDSIFQGEHKLVNTKGNFKSKNWTELDKHEIIEKLEMRV